MSEEEDVYFLVDVPHAPAYLTTETECTIEGLDTASPTLLIRGEELRGQWKPVPGTHLFFDQETQDEATDRSAFGQMEVDREKRVHTSTRLIGKAYHRLTFDL